MAFGGGSVSGSQRRQRPITLEQLHRPNVRPVIGSGSWRVGGRRSARRAQDRPPSPSPGPDPIGTSPVLQLGETGRIWREQANENPSITWVFGPDERIRQTYDIFEGTEQIQQLVIARAISGLRIE